MTKRDDIRRQGHFLLLVEAVHANTAGVLWDLRSFVVEDGNREYRRGTIL